MHDCKHEFTEIRFRNRSVGMIGRQCVECGRRVGGWIKHSEIGDLSGIQDWIEEGHTGPANDSSVELVDPSGSSSFVDREKYAAYLASDLWTRRRNKVMDRCGGVCEGCMTNKATDVHHLTYRHVYNEFAFELVALCRSCHERAHDIGGK